MEFSEVQDTRLRMAELHFHQKPLESAAYFPILVRFGESLYTSSVIPLALVISGLVHSI